MKNCHVELHPKHDSSGKLFGWLVQVVHFCHQTDPRVVVASAETTSLIIAEQVVGNFAAGYLE